MTGGRSTRLGRFERPVRRGIACITVLYGVAGLLILLSDAGPTGVLCVGVFAVVCLSTVPVALWWLLRARLRASMGPWFVVYADVGVAIEAFLVSDRDIAFWCCTLFVVVGYYVSFFVGSRAVLLHTVFVAAVVAVLAWLTALDETFDGFGLATRAFFVLLINVGGVVFLQNFNVEVRSVLRTQANLVKSDPLTGLLNRRGFEADVERLLDSTSADEHIAVASVDIDRFKSVNDRHGHGVGDTVLVLAATRLKAECPDGSIVARSGGEEFTVATVITRDEMGEFAERLRTAVYNPEDPVAVTVSVGITGLGHDDGVADGQEARRPTDRIRAALGVADAAMYQAKRAGGNQSCVLIVEK